MRHQNCVPLTNHRPTPHLVCANDFLQPARHAGEGVLALVDHVPGELVSHDTAVTPNQLITHLRSVLQNYCPLYEVTIFSDQKGSDQRMTIGLIVICSYY